MDESGEDDLIPVRMINELVYCPRLFWLEEVAGQFAENHHVVEGQTAHRRVDEPRGSIAAPVDEAPPWKARALSLASLKLGVSAKLDLVDEDEDGSVMPVDTKKGAPPKEGLWPADEVQLVLQALLLREHGYRCHRVAAYYAAERRRVVVEVSEERIAAALAAIEEARRVRATDKPPPPLQDSPKCPGCSLNAICQPDEIHALIDGDEHDEERPLRRVVPPQDDAKPLIVLSSTSRIGRRQDTLVIEDKRDDAVEPHTVGINRLLSVSVYGQATISTAALHACLDHRVPVSFFTSGGFYLGRVAPTESGAVHVRRHQYRAEGTLLALDIARVLIADKIANSRTLLRRNLDGDAKIDAEAELLRLARLVEEAERADEFPALLAIEGEAAKRFWALYSSLMSRDDAFFAMKGRSRRPPRDATNAMVSYISGMLVRDCAQAVANAGMDALVGVYHTAHHGRPSLALDLMEPFRPLLLESVVLGLVRRGEVTPASFVNTGPAVVIGKDAKKTLATAYERRAGELITHPVFGYRVSYRQTLTIQARLLGRVLVGEIPRMPSFRTR